MANKIDEIRIVHIDSISPNMKEEVQKRVATMPIGFKKGFKGYAKITYIINSPRRISSVEPITGTSTEYFKTISKEGVEIPNF